MTNEYLSLDFIQQGNVALIEVAPSIGKTGLALSWMLSAAEKGMAPLYISREMSTDKLIQRLLSISSGINLRKIDKGDLTEEDKSTIDEYRTRLSSCHISIEPADYLKEALPIIDKYCNEKQADIAFVDYLDSREDEEEALSAFKGLAKALNIPIIILKQIPRVRAKADVHLRLIREDEKARLIDMKGTGPNLDLIFNPKTTAFRIR